MLEAAKTTNESNQNQKKNIKKGRPVGEQQFTQEIEKIGTTPQ